MDNFRSRVLADLTQNKIPANKPPTEPLTGGYLPVVAQMDKDFMVRVAMAMVKAEDNAKELLAQHKLNLGSDSDRNRLIAQEYESEIAEYQFLHDWFSSSAKHKQETEKALPGKSSCATELAAKEIHQKLDYLEMTAGQSAMHAQDERVGDEAWVKTVSAIISRHCS